MILKWLYRSSFWVNTYKKFTFIIVFGLVLSGCLICFNNWHGTLGPANIITGLVLAGLTASLFIFFMKDVEKDISSRLNIGGRVRRKETKNPKKYAEGGEGQCIAPDDEEVMEIVRDGEDDRPTQALMSLDKYNLSEKEVLSRSKKIQEWKERNRRSK